MDDIDYTALREKMLELWIERAEIFEDIIQGILVGREDKEARNDWRTNSDAISDLIGPYVPITQSQKDAHVKSGYPSTSDNENRHTIAIMMKQEAGYAVGWFIATKNGDTGNANKYDHNWQQNIASLSNFLIHMLPDKEIPIALNGLVFMAKKEMVLRLDNPDAKADLKESASKVANSITNAIIKKFGGT